MPNGTEGSSSSEAHRQHIPDRHLAEQVQVLDFSQEFEELQKSDAWAESGHVAKTLVKYDDLRVVMIALKAGVNVTEHRTGARISIQTLTGRVLLRVSGREFTLSTGMLAALDRSISHDLVALEDSAVLLTLCWEPGNQTE